MKQINITGTRPSIGVGVLRNQETGQEMHQVTLSFQVLGPAAEGQEPEVLELYQFPIPSEGAKELEKGLAAIKTQFPHLFTDADIWTPTAPPQGGVKPPPEDLTDEQKAKMGAVRVPGGQG